MSDFGGSHYPAAAMADIATRSSDLAAAAPAAPEDARWRVIARNAFPFIVVFAMWEIVARLGVFPATAVSVAARSGGQRFVN